MIKEAMLWSPGDGGKVECHLCSHRCVVADGRAGVCGVRENRGGKLFTRVYAEVIAAHVDPIEKKPLYHFLPDTVSYSLATAGCNFKCPFCQNWQISQASKTGGRGLGGQEILPEDAVRYALSHTCRSVSYTYTEPTIFFEYAYDTAKLAKARGLANVFVTNGYMTAEALQQLKGLLDAANVDLKSFQEETYQKVCGGHLKPVLESIRLMKNMGVWVEVTTLIVPGLNDSGKELGAIARFLADIDPNMPWHISRFHPEYKYTNTPATPVQTLRDAMSLGRNAGLRYIYIGNVPGESEKTVCPQCQRTLIKRMGFYVEDNLIQDSRCPQCGTFIAGVWEM